MSSDFIIGVREGGRREYTAAFELLVAWRTNHMTAFLINDGRSRQAKTSAGKTRGDLSTELGRLITFVEFGNQMRMQRNLCRVSESINQSIYSASHLSIHPSIYLSICHSYHLSINQSIDLYIHIHSTHNKS
jgi:hypothetical protein